MTDDDGLLAQLKQAGTPAPPPRFQPRVIFQGRRPSEIITPPLPPMDSESEFEAAVRELGYPLPEGYTLVLAEMMLVEHETFWKRDAVTIDGHKQGQGEAYTEPSRSFRYRFKVVPKDPRADQDIAVLMAEAKAAPPRPIVDRAPDAGVSKVINLADFQWGKVDENGGSAETLARSEAALAKVRAELIANPVDEIILIDNGDALEGFESSPSAERTNDLQQTEQVRVARRVFWRWLEALAPLAPGVVFISVPSNHCRVRRGKAALGHALDDWGIELNAQLSDIAAANPAAYGHVKFIVPEEHQEHVLLTLAGGQVLGVAHGHQKASVAALTTWIKATGRRGLQQADIVVVGHFHHLVVQAFGDMQWLFVCPTNDNGSSWFTPSSGERSESGILTFRVDARGWYELAPIWLGNIV